MKIFVISLEQASDRRANISRQFSEIGVSFEFFLAVDGRHHPHALFKRYNPVKRLKIKGEPLTAGQLGCFASHFLLWQKCLDLGEPIIVIEDDAVLEYSRFLELLDHIDELAGTKIRCLRLFKNKSKNQRSFPLGHIGGMEVRKFTKGHMSTTGYYLSPEAARNFIRHAQEWVLPVDMYMDMFWRNKVQCYGICPPCLTNDEDFESMIDYIPKSRKKRGWPVRVKRELYSAKENLLKALSNGVFLLRNLLGLERIDR